MRNHSEGSNPFGEHTRKEKKEKVHWEIHLEMKKSNDMMGLANKRQSKGINGSHITLFYLYLVRCTVKETDYKLNLMKIEKNMQKKF